MMMYEYPKIQSLYKRDDKGNLLVGKFSRPEFQYLYDNHWLLCEKVDGTNIRLGWDHEWTGSYKEQFIKGKTDMAQIPPFLFDHLMELQETLPYQDVFGENRACLYGEGYGARIQKGGGNYISDGVGFILFDVLVNGRWWLDFADVQDVAQKLGIDCVPAVGIYTLREAEILVREGFASAWKNVTPEGVVARPTHTLFNKKKERIMCKIKGKDFHAASPD